MQLPKSQVNLTPEEEQHLKALAIDPEEADQLLYEACGTPPTQFSLLTLAILLLKTSRTTAPKK